MSLNCNFCYSQIESNVIKCPECNLPYHDNCWKKNKSKCTEYNCKGTTKEPENSEKENTQPLNSSPLQENKLVKASNQKILFILVGIIGILVLYILYSTNLKHPIQQANNTISNVNPTSNETPLPSIEAAQIQETSQPTEEPNIIESTPTPTEEATQIPVVTSENKNNYSKPNSFFSIQVASRFILDDAIKISNEIPNSRIAIKNVNNQNRYVVVVGEYTNKEDARLFKNELISKYSYVGEKDDIPESFVIDMYYLNFSDAYIQSY